MKIITWHFKKSTLQVYVLRLVLVTCAIIFIWGRLTCGLGLQQQAHYCQRLLSFLLLHERSGTCQLSRIDIQFIIIFQIFKWHFFQRLAVFLKRQCQCLTVRDFFYCLNSSVSHVIGLELIIIPLVIVSILNLF